MNRYLISLVAAAAVFTGCGSGSQPTTATKAITPEDIAKKFNDLDAKYQSQIVEFEKTYVMSFDPASYEDREAAKNAFVDQFNELYRKYEQEKGLILLEYNELQNKYGTTNEEIRKFDKRFSETRVRRTLPTYTLDSLPETVSGCVNRIIPPYPDADDIARDLVGRKLAEGYGDGYFNDDWRWEVDRDEVSDVKVEVMEQSNSRYSIRASMLLTKGELSMRANVLMYYRLPEGEGWKLDNVVSDGLTFVVTDEYRQFIKKEKSYAGKLILTNIADIPLLVGFVCNWEDGSSYKHYMIVPAQGTESYYPTNAVGFKIDFVLRL